MPFLTTNPVIQRIYILSQAEIDAPTAVQLSDYTAVYQLNIAPYTKYVSNGTTLGLLSDTEATTAIEASLASLGEAINYSLGNKANLDAYDRATHTGADVPVLNELLSTPYTLTIADAAPLTTIRTNIATANSIVLPTYASVPIPVGSRIPVDQWGTGATTITGQTGVVIRSAAGVQARARYSRVWIEKQGTDEWLLTGDLAVGGTLGTAPFCTVAPSISGGPAAGATLTRVAGTWAGSPSPTVTGEWYKDGVATGGTASTYVTATPGDAGKVFTYIESAVSTAGGPTTATSNPITMTSAAATKPVVSVIPVITGQATVGNTLTTTDGTWSNTPTGYTYQWKRNGTNITSATNQTYLLVSSDAGTVVTVTVTASNASGTTDAPSTSLGVPVSSGLPEVSGTSVPSISSGTGVFETGVTLTIDVGVWLNNPTYAYQWYRGTQPRTAIVGQTAISYVTTSTDGGDVVGADVIATNTRGTTIASAIGKAIAVSSSMPVNSSLPQVSGLTPIGSVLSCTTGTWTNSPTYAYQWKRGTTNIGTNSSSYTTVSADGGYVITCVVTATASGLSVSATSSNSITVATFGSGSLSVATSSRSAFTIDTECPIDWKLWPNSLTPIDKNGTPGYITVTDVGSLVAASGTTSEVITWTDGTPTASGTLLGGGHKTIWGDAGTGVSVEFPVGIGGITADIYIGGYNQIVTYTASLSDSSAPSVSGELASGASASLGTRRIRITGASAANGQTLTVSVLTTTPSPYGGSPGDMYIRAIGVVALEDGGGGTGGTLTIAQQIAADMGVGDAPAHGITSWPQSVGGWNGVIAGLRQENAMPSGWVSGTAWGQIYRDYTDSQDTNTRVAIKDLYVYLLHPSTLQWVLVQGPNFSGACYVENYANNTNVSANGRTETDGSYSVKMTHGYNFHFYPNGRWNITTALGGTATPAGYYAVFKARKVIDNAAGTDDRAIAKYLMNVGGDWWITTSAGYAGTAVNNREIGFSRFKYLTNEWNTIRICTLLDPAVAANPPPI